MFVGKAGTYPSEAPFRWYAPGIAHKDQTRPERLVRDKRSLAHYENL